MDIVIVANIKDAELEAKLPPDRVVTIDTNNIVYLYDTSFIITEDMIERVIDGSN